MPTTIYDSSLITQRRKNTTISGSFINRIQSITNPTTGYAPLLGISQQSIINSVITGQMTEYRKNEGGCTTVSIGCPCASSTTPLTPPETGWATRIAGSGDEYGYSITVDSNNNIIVTGLYVSDPAIIYNADGSIFRTLSRSGLDDVFIVKYNSNGFGIWATRIAGGDDDIGYSITVDSNNNIIVTGDYNVNPVTIYNADESTFGTLPNSDLYDAFIVKYDSNGFGTWATRIAGTGNERGSGITVDSNNNIIVTGSYSSNPVTIYNADGSTTLSLPNSGSSDTFIVKYNGSTGAATWATRIAGTGNDLGQGVIVDRIDNSIIVTGSYTGTGTTIYDATPLPSGTVSTLAALPAVIGGSDVFIVKYSSLGVGQWATRIGGTGNDSGNGITVDSNRDIIVTGYYTGTVTIYDAIPLPSGTVSTLAALPNSGGSDVFIVKYSSLGVGQWATRIGGTGNDIGNGITVDSNNNIIVTGQYGSNPVTIYNAPGGVLDVTLPPLVNSGINDAFIVKYNSNGVGTWATRIAGSNDEFGYGITVDSNNNIIVSGQYNSKPATIYNADGSIFGTLINDTIIGISDTFIVKYKPNGFVN